MIGHDHDLQVYRWSDSSEYYLRQTQEKLGTEEDCELCC
jgi:hypothetical protein